MFEIVDFVPSFLIEHHNWKFTVEIWKSGFMQEDDFTPAQGAFFKRICLTKLLQNHIYR